MHRNSQKHPFEPVYDERSKVLILGSFPPNSSQKGGFYYAHKSNRFWKILGELFNAVGLENQSKEDKTQFLLSHNIALWDIFAWCYKDDFDDSSDEAIIDIESQKVDLSEILKTAQIKKIFTTINKQCFKEWEIEKWLWEDYAQFFPHGKNGNEIVCSLYSTSGANWRIPMQKMLDDYKQIVEILRKG